MSPFVLVYLFVCVVIVCVCVCVNVSRARARACLPDTQERVEGNPRSKDKEVDRLLCIFDAFLMHS